MKRVKASFIKGINLGLLLFILLSIILCSCEDPEYVPPTDNMGYLDVMYDSITDGECCSKKYWLSFYDSEHAAYYWYWPAIVKSNETKIVAVGGSFGGLTTTDKLYMEVSHIHDIDTADYKFYVFKCENSFDVGIDSLAIAVGYDPQPRQVTRIDDDSCNTDCCTGTYYYAGAIKDSVTDVIGVKADIKFRFGRLCRQDFIPNKHSHSAAWIGIPAYLAPRPADKLQSYFVQTGYIKRRKVGDEIEHLVYFESNLPGGIYRFVPMFELFDYYDYDESSYSLELNPITGTWYADWSYQTWNQSALFSWQNNYWLSHKGIAVQWLGEIFGWETDMPGTQSNNCTFDNCAYREWGMSEYSNANFDELIDKIGSDDLGHWVVDLDDPSRRFSIYDNIPQ